MAQAGIIPGIFLVDAHPDQVRHDVGESVIVIAFHPDHFDMTLGIRQLADQAKKFPVLFGEPREIQVGEDVAQQNQAVETIFFQDKGRFAGMTGRGSQVEIREDQRVVDRLVHI